MYMAQMAELGPARPRPRRGQRPAGLGHARGERGHELSDGRRFLLHERRRLWDRIHGREFGDVARHGRDMQRELAE
jgi:hypothetical protein